MQAIVHVHKGCGTPSEANRRHLPREEAEKSFPKKIQS
jgi:hypothetical protein